MLDPLQLSALAAIARTGSFERAAADLSVTPSAVSQRIKGLEDRLGAVVVTREAPCRPTLLGAKLVRHYEEVRLLEADLLEEEGPRQLRVAVNADSLSTWFPEVMAARPELLFDLIVTDESVTADHVRRGDVVGAVSSDGRAVAGCEVIPLGAMIYLASATPSFIKRHFPIGVTPSAAVRAPSLTFDRNDGLQRAWLVREVGRDLRPPTHFLPSSEGFVTATLHHLGWALHPRALIVKYLEEGTLSPLGHTPEMQVPLFWIFPRRMRRPLDPLTESVRTVARLHLRT
jgi:LysR family transcriptional regulator (chromosome initiation inhibitor)